MAGRHTLGRWCAVAVLLLCAAAVNARSRSVRRGLHQSSSSSDESELYVKSFVRTDVYALTTVVDVLPDSHHNITSVSISGMSNSYVINNAATPVSITIINEDDREAGKLHVVFGVLRVWMNGQMEFTPAKELDPNGDTDLQDEGYAQDEIIIDLGDDGKIGGDADTTLGAESYAVVVPTITYFLKDGKGAVSQSDLRIFILNHDNADWDNTLTVDDSSSGTDYHYVLLFHNTKTAKGTVWGPNINGDFGLDDDGNKLSIWRLFVWLHYDPASDYNYDYNHPGARLVDPPQWLAYDADDEQWYGFPPVSGSAWTLKVEWDAGVVVTYGDIKILKDGTWEFTPKANYLSDALIFKYGLPWFEVIFTDGSQSTPTDAPDLDQDLYFDLFILAPPEDTDLTRTCDEDDDKNCEGLLLTETFNLNNVGEGFLRASLDEVSGDMEEFINFLTDTDYDNTVRGSYFYSGSFIRVQSFTVNGQSTVYVPAGEDDYVKNGDYDDGGYAVANIPGVGSFTMWSNTRYEFDNIDNWFGTVPTVTVVMRDGGGSTITVNLKITVNKVDDPNEIEDNQQITAYVGVPYFGSVFGTKNKGFLRVDKLKVGGGSTPTEYDYTDMDATDYVDYGTDEDLEYYVSRNPDYTNDGVFDIGTGTDFLDGASFEGFIVTDNTGDRNVLGWLWCDRDGDFMFLANPDVEDDVTLPITTPPVQFFVADTIIVPDGPDPDGDYDIVPGPAADVWRKIFITIKPNTKPTDPNESITVFAGLQASGNLLTGAVDKEGNLLSVRFFSMADVSGSPFDANGDDIDFEVTDVDGTTIETYGVVTVKYTGEFTFTSDPEFTYGAVPPITYRVMDGALELDFDTSVTPQEITTKWDFSTDAISTLSIFVIPEPVDISVTCTEDLACSGNAITESYKESDDALPTGYTMKVTGFTVSGLSSGGSLTTFSPGETATVPNLGTFTVSSTGAYSFDNVQDWYGSVPLITITVEDGGKSPSSFVMSITVNPGNDAPNARDVSYTCTEDVDASCNDNIFPEAVADVDPGNTFTVKEFRVLPDGALTTLNQAAPAEYVDVTLASGKFSINAKGDIKFDNTLNWNGVVQAEFKIQDQTGTASANMARITVTVTNVDDAPVAKDFSFTCQEDVACTGSLLPSNGATDPDVGFVPQSHIIYAFQVSGTSGTFVTDQGTPTNKVNVQTTSGQFSMSANGEFTFTPFTANWNGVVPDVLFGVEDSTDLMSATFATLKITVAPINDAPVAVDQTKTCSEDDDSNCSGNLLTGASDVDAGDTHTVKSFSVAGTLYVLAGDSQSVDINAVGALTVNKNGAWTFNNVQDFQGALPEITFVIQDQTGAGSNTAKLIVVITNVNDPPVAKDASFSCTEDDDSNCSWNALPAGVTEVDPTPTNFIASFAVGATSYTLTAAEPTKSHIIAGQGVLSVSRSGAVTFNNEPNWSGVVTATFRVTDQDNSVSLNTATMTITITDVNDTPPTANNIAKACDEDVECKGNILADGGASDPVTTNTHTIDSITVYGQTFSAPTAVDISMGGVKVGTLTVAANGGWTYDNVQDDNSDFEFTFVVLSSNGQKSQPGKVTITLNSVNDLPVANSVTRECVEDTTCSGNFITGLPAGATDVDAASVLKVQRFTVSGILADYFCDQVNPFNPTVVDLATLGKLSINANGDFIFVANGADFNGALPVVSYIVMDEAGATSNVATLSVSVAPINDAPVDDNDVFFTSEDTDKTGNVLDNARDVDKDALVVTEFTATGTVYAAGSTAIIPDVGTLVLNSNGAFIFSPLDNYNGNIIVDYTVSDGKGGSDSSTLTIVTSAVNDASDAENDFTSTLEDTPVTITVLENDKDIDTPVENLIVSLASNPKNGAAVVNADGSITYTPAANYAGVDSFDYRVADGAASSIATVFITVTDVNDPPVALNDVAGTNEDTSVTVKVLDNDSDADDKFLSVVIITLPQHGSAIVNADGSITYIPAANYNGVDSLVYRITDAGGLQASATLSLSVAAVFDPPVASADSAITLEDSSVIIRVLDNDANPDGLVLSVVIATPPSNGAAIVNPDRTITYTPAANYNGADSFSYTISGGGVTSTAAVSVTVTSEPDTPVANDDVATTDAGAAKTINVLANDGDVDGGVLTVTIVSGPSDGTAVVNSDGSITYTPNAGFANENDGFTYRITDSNGLSDTATVIISVIANKVSVQNDVANTNMDTTVRINVAANDGNVITGAVLSATEPNNGEVVVNADNTISYTPAPGFIGVDAFEYSWDLNGQISEATVTVNIGAVTAALTDDALTVADAKLPKRNPRLSITWQYAGAVDVKASYDVPYTATYPSYDVIAAPPTVNCKIQGKTALCQPDAFPDGLGVYYVCFQITYTAASRLQPTRLCAEQTVNVFNVNMFVTTGTREISINSPAGAISGTQQSGKATASFEAKWLDANGFTAQSKFSFKVGSAFSFASTSMDALVVIRPRAQFKGTGTAVVGGQTYNEAKFIVTLVDGSAGVADAMSVYITSSSGEVLYDNDASNMFTDMMELELKPSTTVTGQFRIGNKKIIN